MTVQVHALNAGLSWSGYNICGDVLSIEHVKGLVETHGSQQAVINELRELLASVKEEARAQVDDINRLNTELFDLRKVNAKLSESEQRLATVVHNLDTALSQLRSAAA